MWFLPSSEKLKWLKHRCITFKVLIQNEKVSKCVVCLYTWLAGSCWLVLPWFTFAEISQKELYKSWQFMSFNTKNWKNIKIKKLNFIKSFLQVSKALEKSCQFTSIMMKISKYRKIGRFTLENLNYLDLPLEEFLDQPLDLFNLW